MKVARLSAHRTGCLYPTEDIPGTHFCEMLCRLQGYSVAGRKIPMTPSGIEPATFQLVVQCLKQLRHRHGNWIVVPSLLGFGSLKFLLEDTDLFNSRNDVTSQNTWKFRTRTFRRILKLSSKNIYSNLWENRLSQRCSSGRMLAEVEISVRNNFTRLCDPCSLLCNENWDYYQD